MVVEGWWIVEVGFFEVSLGNHRSDGFFCASTLVYAVVNLLNRVYPRLIEIVNCKSFYETSTGI